MHINMLASVASVFTAIGYVIVAILILLVMITVHEFGHYVAGKILKFKINEFSIGFGKAIVKKKRKNGETFAIRIFPLGGFCAFQDEEDEAITSDSFNSKAPWKRIIVFFSGAFFNYVFAIILVAFSFVIFGQFKPTVANVYENAPSPKAEVLAENMLQKDDIILKVNGRDIYLADDVSKGLSKLNEGDAIDVQVSRNGEVKTVTVTIRQYLSGNSELPVGTGLGIGMSSVNYRYKFFPSIGRSFVYCFKLSGAMLSILGQLITGALGIRALGGPISTIAETSKVASMGFNYILEITALIGVNLAVFNLLPIPALDGSKIVFTGIEWVRRKPINRKIEMYIHFIGLIILFAFVIFIDIFHLFGG